MALMSQLFAGDPLLEKIARNQPDRISTEQNRFDQAVGKVQAALENWDPGILVDHGIDGEYGSETADAVFHFKIEQLGLDPTGVVHRDVGPETVRTLDRLELARESQLPPLRVTPEQLAFKESFDPVLLALPGVVGTGIGRPLENGQVADRLVVSVFLAPEASVPEGMMTQLSDDLPIEVEIGDFAPCGLPPDEERFDELKGGISVGRFSTGQGTMGAIVRDDVSGSLVGLSCQHVVLDAAPEGFSSVVWQPPINLIFGAPMINALGPVVRSEKPQPNPLTSRVEGFVDAAIFKTQVSAPAANQRRTATAAIAGHDSAARRPLVPAVRRVDDPADKQAVRKRGRRTGLTTGQVRQVGVELEWDRANRPGEFLKRQMIITGDAVNPDGKFCDDGDSGALVLDSTKAVGVGLLWGKGKGGAEGMATPLTLVQSRLTVTVAWKTP